MNEQRTASILQRISVILAVTAASYGLTQAQPARTGSAPARAKSTSTALSDQPPPTAVLTQR